MKDLVSLVNEIQEKGAGLHSLNDHIDTTTPQGKFTFHLFAALAEFERDIIRERTKAGLAAARTRGRKGGRPKGLSKKAQHTAILAALASDWSNGQTEGFVNKLKLLKRQMYGRADLDLLKIRLLALTY